MATTDFNFATPMVKVVDPLHDSGFVLVSKIDFEERAKVRAAMKKNDEDPDAEFPEMVRFKDKPAAPATPPNKN